MTVLMKFSDIDAASLARQPVSRRARIETKRRRNAVGALPSAETCDMGDLVALAASGRRYGTVLCDPPWLYNNQASRGATSNHYGGMTVDELCAMPVGQLAAPDAHLHLWVTNAFLFSAPRIFEAWGFVFRSSFVWCKPKMGCGNYWRSATELLLTAVRGNATRFADKSLMSWMECDRGAHSSKPEQVRGFIERASPGPYLELFGRRADDQLFGPPAGWTVWGDQVRRADFEAGL